MTTFQQPLPMKVNLATQEGIFETEGELIIISGHQCILHEHLKDPLVGISDFKSGVLICAESTKEEAIQKMRDILSLRSQHDIIKATKGELVYYGLQYPVNKPS